MVKIVVKALEKQFVVTIVTTFMKQPSRMAY